MITPVWGSTNTNNYDYSIIPGSLTIDKSDLVINLNLGEKVYQKWVTPYASATCNGSSVSSSDMNKFSLSWGDSFKVNVSGVPDPETATPGTYDNIEYSCTFTSGDPSNYNISFTNTTLTVIPDPESSDAPPTGYNPDT